MLRIFRHVAFAAGTALVRQGQPAVSAFVLESGSAEVMTVLPGGGELSVAMLGPGAVLGETALLEGGVRSATVVAREPVNGYWIERDSFRMLLVQRNYAVLKVQHRITLLLCRRLRELNARIVQSEPPGLPVAPGIAAGDAARLPVPFPWREFLPVLPVFRGFSADDIEEIVAGAQAYDLPRGAVLFRQRESASSCWIIVRGAIEVGNDAGASWRRIGILGPGRWCGILALIECERHSMTALAREHATVLEIPRSVFERLYRGDADASVRFQQSINQELLHALERTNNGYTRLISQARIRGARAEAESLQREIGAQDCRQR